jgi:hypothetical protein
MWRLLLIVHGILLFLAATNFTLLTWFGDGTFQWEFYRYATRSGWGEPYISAYRFPVVATYVAAYAVGFAAYLMAWRRGFPVIGAIGMLLCAAGGASFAFELTHWVYDHHRSWIVSAPAPVLLLAIITLVRSYWRPTLPTTLSNAQPDGRQ